MIFLGADTLYKVLTREGPEDLYIQGNASAGFYTASVKAEAQVLASVYGNLERVFDNIFPQTADELIGTWESTVFPRPVPELPTLQDRRDRVIQKLRQRRGISRWDIMTLISRYLPEGVWLEVRARGCADSRWRLGVSRLGVETFLNNEFEETFVVGDVCGADFNDPQVVETFTAAYTYDVFIYDYTLSPENLILLEQDLNDTEPARSQRVIYQNVPIAFMNWNVELNNVDQDSNVRIIIRDNTQDTGYRGRKL